ncbi:MAG: DUF4296 domain-containing protein [Paramuribaculum sp.]|nr:DUF4296 domain-containing protein [Paramuribaculum sp.]
MNKLPYILGMGAALCLAACSQRPDGVLDQDDMAQLLADIHIGESVVDNNFRHYNSDSSRSILRQSIYAKHGITPAQADSSFMWYGRHMDQYIEVYDRVTEILNNRILAAQEQAGASSSDLSGQSFSFEGDSVDVWSDIRYRRLSSNMPSNYIYFSLPSDRNWEKGDAYELRAKMIGGKQSAHAVITAEYHDGTREYVTSQMGSDGWRSLKMVLDSARMPFNVAGYIYYEPQPGEVAFIDSISLTRTRWGAHQREARSRVQKFKKKSEL